MTLPLLGSRGLSSSLFEGEFPDPSGKTVGLFNDLFLNYSKLEKFRFFNIFQRGNKIASRHVICDLLYIQYNIQ